MYEIIFYFSEKMIGFQLVRQMDDISEQLFQEATRVFEEKSACELSSPPKDVMFLVVLICLFVILSVSRITY